MQSLQGFNWFVKIYQRHNVVRGFNKHPETRVETTPVYNTIIRVLSRHEKAILIKLLHLVWNEKFWPKNPFQIMHYYWEKIIRPKQLELTVIFFCLLFIFGIVRNYWSLTVAVYLQFILWPRNSVIPSGTPKMCPVLSRIIVVSSKLPVWCYIFRLPGKSRWQLTSEMMLNSPYWIFCFLLFFCDFCPPNDLDVCENEPHLNSTEYLIVLGKPLIIFWHKPGIFIECAFTINFLPLGNRWTELVLEV